MSASSRSIARMIGFPIARPTHFPQINSPNPAKLRILRRIADRPPRIANYKQAPPAKIKK
ncbi:MAG: hypothetical protein LH628_25415 [Microcoleus sp. CAN_BIN18]|nr:hypothetical protein [Microcoleus sp. CAN_BIN18]